MVPLTGVARLLVSCPSWVSHHDADMQANFGLNLLKHPM